MDDERDGQLLQKHSEGNKNRSRSRSRDRCEGERIREQEERERGREGVIGQSVAARQHEAFLHKTHNSKRWTRLGAGKAGASGPSIRNDYRHEWGRTGNDVVL